MFGRKNLTIVILLPTALVLFACSIFSAQTPKPIPTPAPTDAPSVPKLVADTVFRGTFDGGMLIFTIDEDAMSIKEGWEIAILPEAICAEGQTVGNSQFFHSFSQIPIQDATFEDLQDNYGGQDEFRGQFDTATTASGILKKAVHGPPNFCTIGPVEWVAIAE